MLSPLRRPRRRCSRRCPGGRAGCTRRGRGRTSDRHRTSWCLVVARRGRGRASPLCASKICCVSLQPALSATANALSKLAPWRPICAWMGEGANVGRGAEFRTGVRRCGEPPEQCGAQPWASQGCIGLGRAWDTRQGSGGSDYHARTLPSPPGAEKVRKKEGTKASPRSSREPREAATRSPQVRGGEKRHCMRVARAPRRTTPRRRCRGL